MKIVLLCNEYPPHPNLGGIGIFTHTLAHGLIESGHEVTILGIGKKSVEWNDSGIKVIILPESVTRGVAWLINRRKIYSWLKKQAHSGYVDIIETPEYQGMLPFKFPWCPVVVRLHLHSSGVAARWIIRLLEKETLKCHVDWIAVSKWILKETQDFFNVTPSRSQVIYNPVVISKGNDAIPFPMPDCYVLYAGTVSDRKGAFVLAEAARSFFAAFPSIHLVYVGGLAEDGGQRADEIIHQIIGDRFADRVHFTGPVAHDVVLSCMKKARVFVFPSKLESFGLVPVEAMLCGTPVVFSTLHVGPEIIDDEISGLLADPYNPNDVAEKVMLILTDHAFADRLAENAKQVVQERFSLQHCIDETIGFYQTCISESEKKR